MTLQQKISLENNQKFIGKTLDVLIESYAELDGSDEQIAIGRSYRDAPEIDGVVLVEGNPPVGEIVPVAISGAMTYDLNGVYRPE
jgi:ribosomal protein S12 methylthiotransferase